MPESQKIPSRPNARSLRYWIGALTLLSIAVMAAVAGVVISRSEPILRARVIDTLSTRFKSQVELDAFHVSLLDGLQVSGEGLRIFGQTDPNNHEPGVQPIIGVAEFRFRTGILSLFRSPMHVDTVYVKGLQLNLPPREQRGEMRRMSPRGGKIRIVVDHLECDQAQLIINTLKPGKLPLQFDIEHLKMASIGPGAPMAFAANLTNPKPVGNIISSGSFGPWNADSPRDTPVSGTYSFDHADLGTIKGIGGILSSKGRYAGVLDRIVVDGATDTPDFRIAISGRSVPLHTDFHAIVDGTSGDTYLQPVRARILDSWLTANGSVVRTREPRGHYVALDVVIKSGRIEDLLKLAIRTDPPIMTGAIGLKTHFDLPPGNLDLANRLKLAGDFQVSGAHFDNVKVQEKVDALSMRSQGKPKLARDNVPDNVQSDLKGTFRLDDSVISFSQLEFEVPGADVNLTGQYSLDGNQFDFHGRVRMEAKLSQMVTGWKSILLKPVDPFFSKHGAGTELPVKVTGTKSEPHFGTDFRHKDRGQTGDD
ncbi:MAG: AsmA-like C-terminal region-containing protein [Terriglobales bacterium]